MIVDRKFLPNLKLSVVRLRHSLITQFFAVIYDGIGFGVLKSQGKIIISIHLLSITRSCLKQSKLLMHTY